MKTIKVLYQGFPHTAFTTANEGSVWNLTIHELKYPLELRQSPPRVRLLENAHPGHVLCELIDDWPGAPEYWPPESAPVPAKTKPHTPAANQGRKSA